MVTKVEKMTEAVRLVASSVDQFCTQFYKIYFGNEKDNIICSPLSVDIILTMLSYGTSGTTQKQLHDVLGITINENVFQTGYGNFVDSLNKAKGVDLSLATKLFSSKTVPIKPEYLALSKTAFRSALEQIDFSDANTAAHKINTWCEEQTNKKIKEIVNSSDLNSDTALVLANAIYFKGQWKDKFDPLNTTEMPFYIHKTDFINVLAMKRIGSYNNGFIDELMASFIEIPYVGDELSMVIIMPVEFGGLAHVIENINLINITEVLKTGLVSKVELSMPKFKIETSINLQDILQKMGLNEIFTNRANFSNMTDLSMSVSKAIQKAYIVCNEEGSEAAAVTEMVCNYRSLLLPKCFSINQPFIFQLVKIVRDNDDIRIALPLFAGVVQEPKFND